MATVSTGPAERPMDRLALGLISAGHFSVDLCQGAVPSMLPFFVRDRHLTYAAAAGLVLAQTISSSVLQPLFGGLSDRRPASWLMPAGVAVAAGGLVSATQLPTYGLIWLAIAVSGVGVAAYHPEGARYASYASGQRRATGMSFFSVGGSAGFAAAPVLVTPILLLVGLRAGWLMGVIPFAVAAAIALQGPRLDAHRVTAERRLATEATGRVNRWGPFARLTGALLARSVIFYGLNTFVPLYWIVELHQSPAAAGAALATLLIAGGSGTLIGGRLADRFPRRSVVVVATALTGPLLLLLLSVHDPLLAGLVLVPLALAMYVPTSIMVVLGQEYLPARVGTASGVTLGLAVSAGGVVTPAVGYVADRTDLHTALLLLVVLPLAATVLAVSLPRR